MLTHTWPHGHRVAQTEHSKELTPNAGQTSRSLSFCLPWTTPKTFFLRSFTSLQPPWDPGYLRERPAEGWRSARQEWRGQAACRDQWRAWKPWYPFVCEREAAVLWHQKLKKKKWGHHSQQLTYADWMQATEHLPHCLRNLNCRRISNTGHAAWTEKITADVKEEVVCTCTKINCTPQERKAISKHTQTHTTRGPEQRQGMLSFCLKG